MPSHQTNTLLRVLDEKGGALPSILFLVTILSTAAASVILLHFLNAQLTQREIGMVKADYASQSGIATMLSRVHSLPDVAEATGETTLSFEDGSRAIVSSRRWGLFSLINAEGRFRKTSTRRLALTAERLSKQFVNALMFTNADHQLVIAGTTSIKGDIVTGALGISTGTLKDRVTPRSLPIDGNVKKDRSITSFKINRTQLLDQVRDFDGLLGNNAMTGIAEDATLRLVSDGKLVLSRATIRDSITIVLVKGNVALGGPLSRRDQPLTIVVDGVLSFQNDCQLRGLIRIVSSKEMRIPANILIDTPIIYSQKGIVVENSAEITAQLFADSIVVKSKSTLRYPSVVATLSGPGNKTVQIEAGAHIEGTVLSFSGNDQRTPGLVTIHPGAEVTGLVYAEDRLTLDGSVRGIVIAKDFYFYEAPTTYLGWIRSGTIDRSRLPNSFLLPLGVSSSPQYEVLDWL